MKKLAFQSLFTSLSTGLYFSAITSFDYRIEPKKVLFVNILT